MNAPGTWQRLFGVEKITAAIFEITLRNNSLPQYFCF